MELASCVINAALVGLLVWLGGRRFGPTGAAVFAAVAAVAVRGYGPNVLSHPWNPYFPVLLWLVAAIAAWLALDGNHWLATVVVATTSVAAQTHVPYLVNAIALNALVIGVIAWRVWRRGAPWRPLATAFGVGALVWLAPFVEQLVRSPGNIGKLIRHFMGDSHEPAIGVGAAGRLVLAHLDWVRLAADLITRKDAFVHRAGVAGDPDQPLSLVGLVVLLAWLAAAVWAWRRRHSTLLNLHAVVATTLVVGFASSTRIFGKVWFYLTLWMSTTALLMLVALVWTAVILVRERDAGVDVRLAALVVAALATVGSIVSAVGQRPPEEVQGENVALAMPDVTPVLDRDARYVVFWQESIVPGSQGWAVFNELERRGFEVGTHATWHVAATEHRVFAPGTFDAEVHVVSGGWISDWAADHPGAERIVTTDHRSAELRQRFDQLDQRVAERLTEIGRADLIEVVDRNLFGASLDPDLPADIVDDLSEMILIGEPLAIFLAPPGSTN
mgnify:FL=1